MDTARLKEHLARQLRFLERSALAFDDGHRDEAIRIATTVRVMVHQTPASTSLRTRLDARNTVKLVSTVKPPPPNEKGTLAVFDGVATMSLDGLEANLASGYSNPMSVDDWWNQLVLVSYPDQLTRKSIVLGAANKDGGAHVDLNLTKEYRALVDGLWTFTRQDAAGAKTLRMTDHQFIALRQFAYELLQSPQLRQLCS